VEERVVTADVCVKMIKKGRIINLQVDNMKIVHIFAGKIYSFQFDNETENELRRNIKLWNDAQYIYRFLKDNKNDIPGNSTIERIAKLISDDSYKLYSLLYQLAVDETQTLETLFKQLNNSEYQYTLLSYRKARRNYLRLYALKIDADCFVITGGAIKLTQFMEDRSHTNREILKLNRCKAFLNENGVIDADSFYEFLNEQL
jgi:hypothetical protein